MDEDGVPDLVTASEKGGSVTIVWSGEGRRATTWSMGPASGGLAVADFDGDGRRDVAVTLPGAGAVGVRAGESGRSLAEIRLVEAGEGVTSILAAELDGAAPAELVTATAGGAVRVLHGLMAGPVLETDAEIRGMAAGDWDGDGATDVVLALPGRSVLQVLAGDGRGGLSPGQSLAVGPAPLAVAAADLDGDGALDLASADVLGDTVTVLYGDGAGEVRERVTLPTGPEPRALAVVREAGDSQALHVLASGSSTVERVALQAGPPLAGASPAPATVLAAADRDGDGREELYYAAPDPGEVGALLPGPGLSWATRWTRADVAAAFPIDVEGDGQEEVLIVPATAEPTGELQLQFVRGDGQLVGSASVGGVTGLQGVHALDVNSDGRMDMVGWSGPTLSTFLRESEGGFRAGSRFSAEGFVTEAIRTDVDGDGDLELVLAGLGAGQGLVATSTVWGVDFSTAGEPEQVFQHAIDGWARSLVPWDGTDGTLDLLLLRAGIPAIVDLQGQVSTRGLNAPGFESASAMIRGEGSEVFLCGPSGVLRVADILAAEPEAPRRVSLDACDALALVDLDGDATRDLLVQRTTAVNDVFRTVLTPWIRSGDDFTALGARGLLVEGFGSVRVVEVDGDPQPELLNVHAGTLQVLDLAIDEALAATPIYSAPRSLSLIDVDHDGITDLLAAGATIGVAFGDGEGQFGALQHQDVAAWIPTAESVRGVVRADFEGDGRTEAMLVVRPRDRWGTELHELTLDGGGAPVTERLATVAAGDLAVWPADLDGDHELELLGVSGFGELRTIRFTGLRSRALKASSWAPLDGAGLLPAGSFRLLDLERRGVLDLVAPSSLSGVVVHPGRGDGQFLPRRVWSPQRGLQSISFLDFDRDGDLELLGVAAKRLVVVQGPSGAPAATLPGLLEEVVAATHGDLDGDGAPEILAVTRSAVTDGGSTLHVGVQPDGASFRFTRVELSISPPTSVSVADLDDDGEPEVVLREAGHLAILRPRSLAWR
ncbi:FG-GAP-like repeat-containing protein [Nannocystis pusilla]|uniref:VCBS repeat-containing protein n=1 Tax=Nannocystis pusilla TaxID=889268 RepID=A0ABS7U407_9BACT|nr:FG-GAP-like repeat-containing protein [Nannocystis pusilla]MBZ5715006.1 VCBS repeat-containing protein [Nannocystis pusilla]